MAKKKNKGELIKKVAVIASVLLGLVAFCMLFVSTIGIKDSETTYTGIQIAFGFSEETVLGKVEYFAFSFMNLLTYILALVGVVFAVFALLGKGGKLFAFISAVAFLVAGVFFFLSIAFSVPSPDLEKVVSGLSGLLGGNASLKDSLVLSAGAIVGGTLSIISAIAISVPLFVKE